MAPQPLPSAPGNLELLIRVANCVLEGETFGPNNERITHSLAHVVNCVINAIKGAVLAGREDLLTSVDPMGPLVKVRLPSILGIGSWSISARNLEGYQQDEYSYSHGSTVYRVKDFERHRDTIERIWDCPVTIEPMDDNPLGVTIRPAPMVSTIPAHEWPEPEDWDDNEPVRLPEVIPLEFEDRNEVVLGTDVFTGRVRVTRVSNLPHMLICGTSGFGKSVFLHQIIAQLLEADDEEVAQINLVDLKGGVEFEAYRKQDNRCHVVWKYDQVIEAVDRIIELMEARLVEMRANGWRLYPGRRVFFIVDEFAQIQLYPHHGKEARAIHETLTGNLNRLSMLGRAVGIVLIVAIQKATTDVMDSSFRMNLQGQVCFRVPNRLMAATMFGSVDELELDPVRLTRGQFIYYDPIRGETRYLQAHVADP